MPAENLSTEQRRLWFGTVGSAVSWTVLGAADIFITWKACTHQENFGMANEPSNVTWIFVLIGLILFAVTVFAGIASFASLRNLSPPTAGLETLAIERREFMAFAGVVISVTLGAGILWLILPPFILEICWRAR